MQNNLKSSALNVIVPLVAFGLVLTFLFQEFIFNPELLLYNSDQLTGIGSRFIRIKQFFITEWNAGKLGGTPTIDATFGDVYHPLVLLHFIMDPARAIGFKFILTIWIAFASCLVLGRYLTGSWVVASFPAFLYTLNPQFFTHIYGGHDGKMMVFAVAPLAVLGVLRTVRHGQWWGVFLISISLTWSILSSHLQLTYLFLWGLGFFVLYEVFTTEIATRALRAQRFAMCALGLAIALSTSAFQIIPPYLYTTTQSVRGSEEKTSFEHAVSWSLHPEELASMFVPGFLQADIGKERSYWGHNFFKLNHDAPGTALTFLAFLALFLRNHRRASLFWFLGCALALSYALGANSPVFRLYFEFLPGVKNFRAPSMAIFWIPLAMVLMSIPVLKALRDPEERKELLPGLFGFILLTVVVVVARFTWPEFLHIPATLVSILLGLLLLAVYSIQDCKQKFSLNSIKNALMGGLPGTSRLQQIIAILPFVLLASFFWNAQTAAQTNALLDPNKAQALDGLMRSLSGAIIPSALLVAGTAIAIWIIFGSKLSGPVLAITLVAAGGLELWIINSPFIQTTPKRQFLQPNHPVLQSILQDSPDSLLRPRVISFSRNMALSKNIFPAYNLSNALGFHDNELDSYRRFRGGAGGDHFTQNPMDNPYLQLLNVGYIIYDTQQGTTAARIPGNMGWGYLIGYQQVLPYDSIPEIIGRRGFPFRTVAPVESLVLQLPVWDPSMASVSESPSDTIKADTLTTPVPFMPPPVQGQVKLVAQPQDDHQEFHVQTSQPALLVVAGNYHPYWKATINGANTPVVRAYGTLRAVFVPTGEHTVVLQYRSPPLQKSLYLSALGGVLLLVLLLLSWWKRSELRSSGS